MALIDEQTRGQIGDLFEQLEGPVELGLYTKRPSPLVIPGQAEDECASCADAEQLLTELSDLSDKLTLTVHDVRQGEAEGIERVPALVLRGGKAAGQVRFFGIPAGYEFSTLVADIVDVSRSNVELSEKTQTQLAALEAPVHIQVFVTPT